MTDLDQYHRRVNLEFAGVPEEEGEDPDKLVLQIAKKIHPGISAADIDVVHRLGKANSDGNRGPRTIIARFTNRRSRNAIYDGRRKLQHVTTKDLGFRRSNGNGRIYVNENLVASTRELLKETNKARRSAGYKYLWTNNGRILREERRQKYLIVPCENPLACRRFFLVSRFERSADHAPSFYAHISFRQHWMKK